MECIFCDILNGKLPSRKLYEDEEVIVIMDAFPNVDGHVLIIPKQHYTTILDMPSTLVAHIHELAVKLIPILTKSLNVESLTQCVNYGTMQVVKHYHMHLLPNYGIDKKPTKDIEEIYQIIKEALSN